MAFSDIVISDTDSGYFIYFLGTFYTFFGSKIMADVKDIDIQLIKAAARGDIDAFEQIYRATQGFVYNVALRVTQNATTADDVTQEVFIKMYNSLSAFKFNAALKTWLYRVTVNTAINYYHKSGREAKIKTDPDLVARHQEYTQSPGKIAERMDDKHKVDAMLAQLNPDQRACVVLREIQGLNYQEIAGTLKIKINTVRSRLKRARETLLAYAKKEAYHELPQSAGTYSFRLQR